MNKWGIMQGRFTDKSGFYPQQFPSGNWEREFDVASQQKIQYIEWMFNFDNYENNPLWSRSGREEIKRISAQAGISVVSVCANYFMRQGFFKSTASGRARSLDIYRHLLEAVNDVGAQILVLPLFDDNNPAEKDMEQFYESLMQMADMAEEKHVRLALEADFSADKYMEILSVISSSALGVCYDLGNAAGLGRNIEQELEILHDVIFNVHIKDKPKYGATVMLGEGAVNFAKVFPALLKYHYSGPYILESYYEKNAVEDTKKNLAFVRNCCKV